MTINPKAQLRHVTDPGPAKPAFDRALSVKDVAEILSVSLDTVYRMLREGRMAHQRITPRRTIIRESALNEFLAEVTFDKIS